MLRKIEVYTYLMWADLHIFEYAARRTAVQCACLLRGSLALGLVRSSGQAGLGRQRILLNGMRLDREDLHVGPL